MLLKKLLLCLCLLSALIATGGAVEYVPATAFNPSQAETQLEPGKAALTGHLNRPELANVRVALYPMTAHFQEFLDLNESTSEEPYRSPTLDIRARHCRVVVEAKDGKFIFQGIRPGRYYLEYPAMYNPGDSPEIDEVFAHGGCVYFLRSQGLSVEIPESGTATIEL